MKTTEEQYERIASYLDGQDVQLTVEELALARQIRRHEESLAELDVNLPPQAAERARRRMTAALAKPSPMRRTVWRWAATAAAAVILLAAAFWPEPPRQITPQEKAISSLILDVGQAAARDEAAMLIYEADTLQVELTAADANDDILEELLREI